MVASLSDLAQGEKTGAGAGQGAATGAGNSSARGCKCTNGAGAEAAKNRRDTAWKRRQYFISYCLFMPRSIVFYASSKIIFISSSYARSLSKYN